MKRLVALLFVVLPVLAVLADEVEETLKKARDLERRAGVLLDRGQRAQAFELLAQAAQLRDEARAAAKKSRKEAPAKAKDAPGDSRPKGFRNLRPRGSAHHAAMTSLKQMDAALMNNDLKKSRQHAEEARKALGRWEKELAAREKRLMAASARKTRLFKRVESLEKQLAELRRMIRNPR